MRKGGRDGLGLCDFALEAAAGRGMLARDGVRFWEEDLERVVPEPARDQVGPLDRDPLGFLAAAEDMAIPRPPLGRR